MSPSTLFIIFLSSELHAGPYETKHNIFLFQKRSQKFAFRSTIFFIQKGHFGPLWPSQKLIFTNFRYFFKKTIEKYNEVEYENIFKILIILKNKKVMVTWRWPPTSKCCKSNFLPLQKLSEIFDRPWNDYFWDLELDFMC